MGYLWRLFDMLNFPLSPPSKSIIDRDGIDDLKHHPFSSTE